MLFKNKIIYTNDMIIYIEYYSIIIMIIFIIKILFIDIGQFQNY